MTLLDLVPTRPPHDGGSLRRSMLAWLLWLGNQCTGGVFYELKLKILLRFGVRDGHDLQKIVKMCYACGGEGNGCTRCDDGVYSVRYHPLARFQIEGWVFHAPALLGNRAGLTPGQLEVWFAREQWRNRIEGAKTPRPGYYFVSNEALLWLALFGFGWRVFWKEFRSHAYCYAPVWYPLSFAQRCWFSWRWIAWEGWMERRRSREAARAMKQDNDDLPF